MFARVEFIDRAAFAFRDSRKFDVFLFVARSGNGKVTGETGNASGCAEEVIVGKHVNSGNVVNCRGRLARDEPFPDEFV